MMDWLGLILEWMCIEADHERALRDDDWNVLLFLEPQWLRDARALGGVDW